MLETTIKVEVNGVLYDVPAKVRMSSNVEVKKEEPEEKVEEKKVEAAPKPPLHKQLKEQWQLILKGLELVR